MSDVSLLTKLLSSAKALFLIRCHIPSLFTQIFLVKSPHFSLIGEKPQICSCTEGNTAGFR